MKNFLMDSAATSRRIQHPAVWNVLPSRTFYHVSCPSEHKSKPGPFHGVLVISLVSLLLLEGTTRGTGIFPCYSTGYKQARLEQQSE